MASDEKGAVLRAQAVAYMKDKWGLSILEQAAENAGLIQSGGFWKAMWRKDAWKRKSR